MISVSYRPAVCDVLTPEILMQNGLTRQTMRISISHARTGWKDRTLCIPG